MTKLKISLVTLALLPILTSCIGDYKLYRLNHLPSYSNHNFASYNQNKDLLTVIHGNPTNATKEALDVAVTDAMKGRNAYGYTNFTTKPGDTNHPDTRFVVQFNPDTANTARKLCSTSTPLPTVDPGPDKVSMIMAYCFRNQYLGYVLGQSAKPETPNDPAFLSMIGGAVQRLIPPFDPNNRGSGCRGSDC